MHYSSGIKLKIYYWNKWNIQCSSKMYSFFASYLFPLKSIVPTRIYIEQRAFDNKNQGLLFLPLDTMQNINLFKPPVS